MDILITGPLAVTMNNRDEIIKHSDIVVKNDRIIFIGPSRSWDETQFKKVIRAEDMIAIPGLINSHTHSTQNLLRGMFQKLPLEIWRQYYRAALRTYDESSLYISSMLGAIEMLHNGVTTLLDHFDSPLQLDFKGANVVINSLIDSGIRGVVAYTISDMKYEETIPIKKNNLNMNAHKIMEGITADETKSREAILEDCRNFLKTFSSYHPRIYPIIGPSAPQRCSDQLLKASKQIALDFGVMTHTHVAETRIQKIHAQKIYSRRTIIEHLFDIGFLSPNLSFAHVIWISKEDIKILADCGVSTIHLPASNLKLGSGLAPLRLLLNSGVNVSLGSDGSASNDSQNMFEAMKLSSLIHNLSNFDYNQWISAEESFKMATINGAKTCGLEKEIGSIEKGKLADLVLLKKRSYPFIPLNNVINQLVFSENGNSVSIVIVGGEIVLENGRLTKIDEDKIYSRALSKKEEINDRIRFELKKTKILEDALREMYSDMVLKESE